MIVHFTGYELDLDMIELDDPRDIICGHLIGTADMIAQMADRCYLEKCRDRLYKEFVLGGVAVENARIAVDDTDIRAPIGGTVIFKPVEIGIAGDNYFEVVAGLEEGETVVSGTYQAIRELEDGALVRVEGQGDQTGPSAEDSEG